MTAADVNARIMPRVEELPYHGDNLKQARRFLLEGGDMVPEWQIARPPVVRLDSKSSGICPACGEIAYPYGVLDEGIGGYVDACSTHAVQMFRETHDERWCEVEVFPDGTIGGYGGTVWPPAWPELFTPETVNASLREGGFKLTPLGFKLLGLHVTVTPCEPSPDRRPKWLVRIDGKVAGSLREYPAGLYQLDMVHALGFYETPEEAIEIAKAYVEDCENRVVQS